MRAYRLDDPEYNMNTYFGRVGHFFQVFNPMNSLYTNDQVSKMQAELEKQRTRERDADQSGKNVMLTDSEINQLRKYKTIVNASIHPDTNQPVPWVMRMCAFVPTNLPIIFGMLMTPPTPMNTAFWQFEINYLAVASAGFLNTYCMRMGEMSRGIKVYDEDGECMGISKKCAEKAVIQTSFSRMALSFPIFILPGVSMAVLDKLKMIPKSRAPKTILELAVITFSLWIALPLSVSLFPPKGELKNTEIEEEFHALRNSKGQIVERYYYNKGL